MNTDDSDNIYIHAELTKKIIGALFKVYNSLGYGYREKEYQRAFAKELSDLGLQYDRELYSKLFYNNTLISGFYLDFKVEDTVIVELKIAEDFYKKHFDQVITYLKNHNMELAILAIFTKKKVLIKRIINQKSAQSA